MKKVILLFLIIVFISTCFYGCEFLDGREYKEDIIFQLEDSDAYIVIKEWSFLHAAGADFYYKKPWKKSIHIGGTNTYDCSFAPFEQGLYKISQAGDKLYISWCIDPKDTDRSNWKTKEILIPLD